MSGTVYGLRDPRDGLIHYVGATVRPNERLRDHLKPSNYCTTRPWVDAVRARGHLPEMAVLEVVPVSEMKERETHWIDHLLGAGHPLLNTRPSGGLTGRWGPRDVHQHRLDPESPMVAAVVDEFAAMIQREGAA